MKEIDQAIESVQSANGRKQKPVGVVATTLPNGETPSHEIKSTSATTTSSGAYETTRSVGASSESCSRSSLIIAMEAAAVIGVVCLGVMIAAIETNSVVTVPGRQSGLWTDLAMNLQGQPIVASFNEYIYAPLRGLFIGGGQ